MKKVIIFILICVLYIDCSTDKNKSCYLTGKIINRNSKILILKKQTEGSRNRGIEIPIDSLGRFNYELKFKNIEAYELIFKDEFDKGAWRPIVFFPDNSKISFTLYSKEKADNNKIIGSKLSLEENAYEQIIKEKYYAKFLYLNKKLDSLKKSNLGNSDYAKNFSKKINMIMTELPQFELLYIKKKANLYGYNKLLEILKNEKNRKFYDVDTLKNYCDFFQNKFPNHPYNVISGHLFNGLKNIKIGGKYVNFSAKDSLNNSYTISNIISNNKLTLIDLWAPWCAPCIIKSKKLVPIYEKYKNNGFGIIGVIGGINTKKKYVQAIEKHKYPWLLLAEINNENKLWEKYYISNSGGGQFLVDNKGKIIAINPSSDELKIIITQ